MISFLCAPAGVALAHDSARVTEGQQVFVRWCQGCHARGTPVQGDPDAGPVGRIWAGTYTLEQRYKGAVPAALEERTNLTPELIRALVRNGLNVMPRTRKTEISDDKLDALIAYLTRNNRAVSK
jgi:mono/diheme cytochrome c family protein